MIGISADGDNRLLSAMKARTKFNLIPDIDMIKRFDAESICVQDTTHIGTKFRNRLLNTSILLQIGSKIVTTLHIKTLLDTVEKDVHGLVKTDIFPEDRQNFKSLEKLMQDRVVNAMKTFVVDSEGTIIYLQICKLITSSYMQANLDPVQRIYNIWYALYFLRCWRKWILSQKDYSLEQHFISNNSYTCVEINAHAMIETIVKLRSIGKPNLFKPSLFASQPCEHIFRTMRSMGTVNFTKINFCLNELFHLIARFELMNKIVYSNERINFPRNFQNETEYPAKLPSDQEICIAMENARKNALQKATEFGIYLNANDITTTELQFTRELHAESIIESLLQSNETDEEIFDENSLTLSAASTSDLDSQSSSELTVDVVDSNGSIKTVRKTTFLWMISEFNDKLSSDRLKRVQGTKSSESNSARKRFKSNDPFSDGTVNILKLDELKIGDWAIFDLCNEANPTNFEGNERNRWLIGNVVGFRYIDEKNRPRQYKTGHVSTTTNQNGKNSIEVLAVWYAYQADNILKQCIGKFTVLIGKYGGTIKPPLVKKESDCINYILSFECCELDGFDS